MIVAVLLLLSMALAIVSVQQPATPPLVCVSPEFSQFDFWIGEWDVFDPTGKQVGSNTISKTLDGCALREEWRGAGGSRGGSFNVYHRTDTQWHQAWIDNGGLVLHLRGGVENGAMRMSDAATTAAASTQPINRITWTPNADGTVRQLWETSADKGRSWKVAFNGLYKRRR